MSFLRFLVCTVVLGLASSLATAATGTFRVTVPASDQNRAGIVVSFALPATAPANAELRDSRGRTVPLQVAADRQARFVIASAPAGEALTFTLGARAVAPAAGITAQRSADRLALNVGGQPLFNFWLTPEPFPRAGIDAKFARAGFIHQLMTPAGAQITDSYPTDHLHHYGIWSPWTKTSFQGRAPDFWNVGRLSARVDFMGLDRAWEGPVHGGFVSRQDMVDLSGPAPVTALNETWTVTAYVMPGSTRAVHVFDLEIVQTCATNDPLILPEYHYGGLAFRGAASWQGAANARILTSEGIDDRIKANASRARWVHFWGDVDGKPAGATVLGHPENFRAPQPIRIPPDDPYFCFIPSQMGEWRINPGEPYRARYRFIAIDGAPDPTLIEAYWQGYTQPSNATVEAL